MSAPTGSHASHAGPVALLPQGQVFQMRPPWLTPLPAAWGRRRSETACASACLLSCLLRRLVCSVRDTSVGGTAAPTEGDRAAPHCRSLSEGPSPLGWWAGASVFEMLLMASWPRVLSGRPGRSPAGRRCAQDVRAAGDARGRLFRAGRSQTGCSQA